MADSPKGRPVTPETLFQAGSNSKPVTALGALKLAEKGKLKLDENVNDELVSWKLPETSSPPIKKSLSAGFSVIAGTHCPWLFWLRAKPANSICRTDA
jgi:hypothetical protein